MESIFERALNRNIDPQSEYQKLKILFSKTYGYLTLNGMWMPGTFFFELNDVFEKSPFSSMSVNLSDFFDTCFPLVSEKNYSVTTEKEREEQVSQYLQMCEAVIYLIVEGKRENKWLGNDSTEAYIEHISKIIVDSLNGMGYTLVKDKSEHYVAELIDVSAQATASGTSDGIGDAITDFLCQKPDNENGKTASLKHLTDLIEPLLKKYDSEGSVKETGKYVQTIRHPEIYRKKPEYKWFFEEENYSKNLDSLFQMCVSVVAYDNAHERISRFNASSQQGSQPKEAKQI